MHKIDTPGATAASEFTSGALGGTGTIVGPKWLNAVQRELVAIVTAGGLALSDQDDDQVLDALQILFGRVILLVAPYDVAAGEAILVHDTFAVASAAALSGALVTCYRTGRFLLPKATGSAWTRGQRLYWDAAAKKLTRTSSGNRAVAVAATDALTAATSGNALLDGAGIAP